MTTLTQAKKLLASIKHTESNRTAIDAVKKLIAQVESGAKTESVLNSVKSLMTDAETLNSLNDEITELRTYDEKPKSRAADMAKSRAKADFLRDVRLTP
jgi:ubiquitin-protein ligase